MQKQVIVPNNVNDIDFCILSRGDKEKLENTLDSIIQFHPEARITIANAVSEHDRAYFKKLQKELEERGLLLRIVPYNLPKGVTLPEVFNFFMTNMREKYRLMLIEGYELTEDSNLKDMATIMDNNNAIGVVVGTEEHEPLNIELDKTIGEVAFAKSKTFGKYALVRREITNYTRFTGTDETYISEFGASMQKVPYQMVVLPTAVIRKDTHNEPKESKRNGDGDTTERAVPGRDANGGDGGVLPSGKDASKEDITTRGGQSRGRS